MDSQDHRNPPDSPGGKSHGAHVCTKCGWNYPNPHPSAKNRRAHKKICGTIKGYELLDPEKAKHNLGLQEEYCLDDEHKTPSPRAGERIGDTSEEDVFADAVCEFSCNVVSDSINGKEETATNCAAKSTTDSSETQQCDSPSMGSVMKISQVVQESCEVPTVEIIETYDVPRSVEAASVNQQSGESSIASETLIESSQVIGGDGSITTVGLETEYKGNLHESESKLAPAIGKREDASDSSWNDEVIYSDVEGPNGIALEATNMIYPGEADYIVSENVMVDTSPVEANEAQVISTTQSLPDAENADVSWHETKGLEEFESSHSVNPCLPETLEGEECETDTLTQTENLGIQREGLSMGKEVLLEDKTEPQGQTAQETVETEMISKSDTEDIEMKAEGGEPSLGAAQETVESDPKVACSNSDVSCAANESGVVDLVGHESELSQANVIAEEKNNPISKLSSESSCAAENYVSPVSVVAEGDDTSYERKRSTETSEDEACRESSKEEESSCVNGKNTKDDTLRRANHQTLLESGRTEFHRVVGGLGVIQGNEIDGNNIKRHSFYAEVPVTIESNDHRDLGRLQNLSEAHIRSLVSSPLVSRNNTSQAFETVAGVSDKSGNASQSPSSLAVALSKNQEITMEKTTSWSRGKEQHVPLKNLLSEARSPRMLLEANDQESKMIPRVSSILDQETSPEDGRREVSEVWNSPAKYPVREERKGKGRPFWVPFVCCSSVK